MESEMRIEDISDIIKNFLTQNDSYTSILIDGKWGCGKTTQIKKCINDIDNNNIIYTSLFGVKNAEELSLCFKKIGETAKLIGNVTSIGLSAIPIVGPSISSALSNVLDQYSDAKKIKKDKIFIFDDLERVDKSASLTSILGFFNTLMLNGCRVLCLSALEEIKDSDRRNEFDRFVEKAFDRVYHIDEDSNEIYADLFSDMAITNLERITKGFNGNIRLAKRVVVLCKNVVNKIESFKDDNHDFYKHYSTNDLAYCAMMAIQILYTNTSNCIFTDEERKSMKYLVLSEYSDYFGEKISNRYISKFIKGNEEGADKISRLVRDLIYIEMFNNFNYLYDDCMFVVAKNLPSDSLLSCESVYYLNDLDKQQYLLLLISGIKDGSVEIDRALIERIGEINMYSDLVIDNEIIDIIATKIILQVENGDESTFSKAQEQRSWVDSKKHSDINYIDIIYEKSKKIIEQKTITDMADKLIAAKKNNDYQYLLDTYYDLSEGKLYSKRNDYIEITIKNNYFLPSLEKSISHSMWSFCHQIARYCKTVGIEDQLIDYLKKYVKQYPSEKSLRDKAFAMIYYNIDNSFTIDSLD